MTHTFIHMCVYTCVHTYVMYDVMYICIVHLKIVGTRNQNLQGISLPPGDGTMVPSRLLVSKLDRYRRACPWIIDFVMVLVHH